MMDEYMYQISPIELSNATICGFRKVMISLFCAVQGILGSRHHSSIFNYRT